MIALEAGNVPVLPARRRRALLRAVGDPESARSELVAAAARLRDECVQLRPGLGGRIAHVYNPLAYAWDLHRAYVERFAGAPRDAVWLGMNPGPWGMVQTGVPFGDPSMVRDAMGLTGDVAAPPAAERHPRRPVIGLESPRREVSGTRLWSFARDSYGDLDRFFERFWVVNYCPLAFFDAEGRNLTPPQLPAATRDRLFAPADRHLAATLAVVRPAWLLGIGVFAAARAQAVIDGMAAASARAIMVGRLLHPSPASPRANKGWAAAAAVELEAMGLYP